MLVLRQLEHAIAVAEHRGFRRAAEVLGVSQPTLSRSIQCIEEHLGVLLFDRNRRGVEPTVFGRVLVERGHALIRQRRALEREVELLKGLEIGTLDVGMGPYPAAISGHAAISRLLARHPGIRCRVRLMSWAEVTRAVLEGRCDLGLAEVSVAEAQPELSVDRVLSRRGHFVCRPDHEVLGRVSLGLGDLLAYPWAGTVLPARAATQLPVDVGRAGRREGDRFVPAVCLDVVSEIAALTVDSDVLGAVVLSMVERELEAGQLVAVPYRPPWLRLNAGFITLRIRTLSPVALAFMQLVRAIEAEAEVRDAALAARYVG